VHSWVGLICHPQESKRRVERQLKPPPPCDDFPSLQKDRVLDHG